MPRIVLLWVPPALYAALIFWMSSEGQLPQAPGGDKLAHVIAYVPLAALLVRALRGSTHWSRATVFVVAAILGGIYGVSDELHQHFVPGRFPSAADALADLAGSIIGALSVRLTGSRR